jgi:lipopolysaccharide biosynthesis protein
MIEELIEKKIEYLESLKTKDVRILAKLEELQWILQMIEWEESRQDKFERARKLTLNEKHKLKRQFPKLGGRN